jgi:hypothetical protein
LGTEKKHNKTKGKNPCTQKDNIGDSSKHILIINKRTKKLGEMGRKVENKPIVTNEEKRAKRKAAHP